LATKKKINISEIANDIKALNISNRQLMEKYQLDHRQLAFVLGDLAEKKRIPSKHMKGMVDGYLKDGELRKAQQCLDVIKKHYLGASGIKSLTKRVEAEALVQEFLQNYEEESKGASKYLKQFIVDNPDIRFHPKMGRIPRDDSEIEYANRMKAPSPTLKWFKSEYPSVVLHPEIEHMVKIIETSKDMRTIDKAKMRERLRRITEIPSKLFENISDSHAKRIWHFTLLEMAVKESVTEYMIISQRDWLACQVCERLHGKHFPVKKTYEKIKNIFETRKSSDKIAEESDVSFSFPSVSDIDNKPPDEIREMGLLPPFCDECRCQIIFLWRNQKLKPSL